MNLKEYEKVKGFVKFKPCDLDDFSLIFKLRYGKRFEEIKSLSNLTIGTLLELSKCESSIEFFDKINNDLKLSFIRDTDKVKLVVIWENEVNKISNLFISMGKIYKSNSKYNDVYNKIDKLFNIPVEISLIDSLSKRNNTSWKETEKMKWSIAYFQLLIDRKDSSFQEEISKQSNLK